MNSSLSVDSNALVSEVMSTPVLTTALTDSLWEAWQMLVISGLRHLAVVDAGGACQGVISDRVVLADIPTTFEHLGTLFVSSALDRVPKTSIRPDQTVREAASVMSVNMVDALPVLNGEERLVGIVTSSDIVHWVAR